MIIVVYSLKTLYLDYHMQDKEYALEDLLEFLQDSWQSLTFSVLKGDCTDIFVNVNATVKEHFLYKQKCIQTHKVAALRKLKVASGQEAFGLVVKMMKLQVAKKDQFEFLRNAHAKKVGLKFFCFDVEAFEHNAELILEVGISVLDTNTGEEKCEHFIVKENERLQNGRYVVGNRSGFIHRHSVTLSLSAIMDLVAAHISRSDYIVGHAVHCDLDLLGINATKPVLDVQKIFQERHSEKNPRKLENILIHMGIKFAQASLHNAGNDAHYTLQALKHLLN